MAIKYRKMTRGERNARIVSAIRAQAGVSAPRDPHMQVKKHAALIAADMALIHGGEWRVVIDHSTPMVLVRPA